MHQVQKAYYRGAYLKNIQTGLYSWISSIYRHDIIKTLKAAGAGKMFFPQKRMKECLKCKIFYILLIFFEYGCKGLEDSQHSQGEQ